MTYELHPLCTLFPRLSGAEFDALRDDIKANGLRTPIVLHGGMILDGGNRYRACVEAGVQPQFTEFDGDSLVAFVLSANLHRRHMSAGQQAAIVASAQDWATAQTAGSNQHKAKAQGGATLHDQPLATVADRASQSGASVRTQKMADKVAKADPALAVKVAHGEVSLPKAVEQVEGKKAKRTLDNRPADIPELTDADELAEARDTILQLAEENDLLRDKLAVENMDASETAKTEAAEIISDLRAQVKTLEAELEAVKGSRDTYMREAAEAKKQAIYWRKKAEKAGAAA